MYTMCYDEKSHSHENTVVQNASKKTSFTSSRGKNANISNLEKENSPKQQLDEEKNNLKEGKESESFSTAWRVNGDCLGTPESV